MKKMALDLEVLEVKKVRFGDKTSFENGTLSVCKEELLAAIESDAFKSIEVDLAEPGDSVRIIPVKDVLEPRCKVDSEAFYPGVLAPVFDEKHDPWGCGRTRVLRGCGVVTTGQIVFYQEGIIDMSGPGADYSIYSKLHNVVLSATPVDGISPVEHEKAVRLMGLKASHYLAAAVGKTEADKVEHYELADADKSLPRIGLVYLILAQGLLHDNYIYGQYPQKLQPMFMSPNEFLDGAVVSGNCVTACDKNTTYDHVNHPVLLDLYKRHGKELNFVGVLASPISPVLDDKERCVACVSTLARQLELDGVVVIEEGGGNPESDVMMMCKRMEQAGIKTVLMMHENCGEEGLAQGVTIFTDEATAVVTAGNVSELVEIPPMEKTLGQAEAMTMLSGSPENPYLENGNIAVSVTTIMDAASNIGVSKLGVVKQ